MVAVVDYGVGNLFSLCSSLAYIGVDCRVTGKAQELEQADKIILPGVGAFGDAAAKLKATGLDEQVIHQAEKGKPLLGICLGMQLLFERSLELGFYTGLGLIKGEIRPLAGRIDSRLKVPHMGWNTLDFHRESPLLKETAPGSYVYYVHSYYAADCDRAVVASSHYGVEVPGIVQAGNVYGTQFHPEKSGPVGLGILRAFCELG
ncbi:imidazole glycerol phosphate synthase subunit HisH [Oscillospiraceae bacterium MB08-C2-2]|nr:imidazole glycerol phosphate synthase subunit HisH [Oscillospiraceae bacterium MB08-C2-2]